MKKWILSAIFGVAILGLAVFLPACSGGFTFSAAPKTKISLVKAPIGSTPTATAFQPLASTPTYIPTDYPTPTPTNTPKPERVRPASNTIGVDPIQQPNGQVNIILLGSDQTLKGYIGRTDSILLVTINTKEDTVSLTSFPRDLYVYIPGWTSQRINTAYAHGGFKTFQDTFSHNFGFKPDYFIFINVRAFERVINNIGGIYVDVPQALCDENWGYGLSHCVYPGNQHMDGKEATWYVRSRLTTNDFSRNKRQQLVLNAILDRLIALDTITKIPALYDTYVKNVTTNLDLGTVVSLGPTALKLSDKTRIKHYYVDEGSITHWVTPGGGQVLLPNFNTVRRTLKKALNSP
jgi:LCP family protein required for cell wall assembly